MNKETAKQILREHNLWRRYKDMEMIDPKILWEAIDILTK